MRHLYNYINANDGEALCFKFSLCLNHVPERCWAAPVLTVLQNYKKTVDNIRIDARYLFWCPIYIENTLIDTQQLQIAICNTFRQ